MFSAEFYLNIINQLTDGIYYVDQNRRISFWNRAAEEITGYSAQEMVGKCCPNSGLNHIDQEGRPLCILGCPLYATLADGQQRQHRVFLRHKKGYRVPVQVNIFPVREGEKIVGAVEIFSKDSPRVFKGDLVDQLADIAMHDALTGLPNRRYLESFIEHKIQEFQRFGSPFCVLFADIDNFSHVNNTYGHDAGDLVLKNIAASLRRSVRRNDLVGRWGGEEFLGIYSLSQPSHCPVIAERFRVLVENTEAISDGRAIHATVSVGITDVRTGDTPNSIIDRADELMYQSKRGGKNRVTADVSPESAPDCKQD